MERDDPIKVCRLYEKLSKNGNQYFTGRWGSAKVLLLKGRDVKERVPQRAPALISQDYDRPVALFSPVRKGEGIRAPVGSVTNRLAKVASKLKLAKFVL